MELINSLLNIGTKSSASEITNFRASLINVIAFISACVNYFYVIIFLSKLQIPYTSLYLIGGTISLFTIYLNKIGKHEISAWILLSLIGIVISLTSVISGYDTQCHTILVVVVVCSVLISNSIWRPMIYVLVLIGGFVLTYRFVEIHGPLVPDSKIQYSEFVNYGFALASSFLFAKVILKGVLDYIESLKQTLGELKAKNTLIRDKNTKLELFNTVAAHDLKTPVRTISSFVGLAKHRLRNTESNLDIIQYLDSAEKSAKQMNALINSISQLGELDRSQELEIELVDLRQIIQDIKIDIIKSTYPNAVITIDDIPSVYINRAHARTVFINLLVNACKYNNKDELRISITGRGGLKAYSIFIRDNGIGIDPKYVSLIFQPFEKLHSAVEYEGTGMGLFLCSEILAKYRAKIKVFESSSEGTCFELTFPFEMLRPSNQQDQ